MDSAVNHPGEAAYWIAHLALQPHPEGGWFKETYRDAREVRVTNHDRTYAASSAIYYLLQQGERSVFHRIQADETWHFYAGGALELFILEPHGQLQKVRIGSDIHHGAVLQFTVPAGRWFASRPAPESAFSLCGCTVAPGFEFDEFELAAKNDLILGWPLHKNIIVELTL
jgi:hypothetical protein